MNTPAEWRSLRRRLESLRGNIAEQIRNYPPPIPACDAQYNHLMELRRRLPGELARLDEAASDGSLTIEDFIHGSSCKEALSKLVAEN